MYPATNQHSSITNDKRIGIIAMVAAIYRRILPAFLQLNPMDIGSGLQ